MLDNVPDKARILLVIAENGQILRWLVDCPEWLCKTMKNKSGNKVPTKEGKKQISVESESDVDSDEPVCQHHRGEGKKCPRYHADESESPDDESDDEARPPKSSKTMAKSHPSKPHRSLHGVETN